MQFNGVDEIVLAEAAVKLVLALVLVPELKDEQKDEMINVKNCYNCFD